MLFVGSWRYKSAAAKSKCRIKVDTIVPLLRWRPCIMVGRHDALPPCFASKAEHGARVEWDWFQSIYSNQVATHQVFA
jgi:hypothetical protein